MAKTCVRVELDSKEVLDAVYQAAKRHAGDNYGGSTTKFQVNEKGEVTGAVVEFQKSGK